MSNFSTLNIARRSLETQRRALEVTAHNVANASTPGYTRQRAVLQTTTPHSVPSLINSPGAGQMGTGVYVAQIQRLRDDMLDQQVRHQQSIEGYWNTKHHALEHLEAVFLEPSDSGLNKAMEEFWNSWDELAKNPSSMAVRTSLLENTEVLTGTFQTIANQTEALLTDIDRQMDIKVKEVNNLADNIAQLNRDIVAAKTAGYSPNDLEDRRDLLIDELSKLTDITLIPNEKGAININVGGRLLVQEAKSSAMETSSVEGRLAPVWSRDKSPVATESGEIAGLMDVGEMINDRIYGELNNIATQLTSQINELHQAGFDLAGSPGASFLEIPAGTEGREARFIALSGDVKGQPHKVAAAQVEDSPGDGSNALEITRLRSTGTMDEGRATFQNHFNGIVTNLGFEVQSSERATVNQGFLREQLEHRRQAAGGVSIDEEISHMIQMQHVYQASSKLISTVDGLLSTLINEMGRR